jgi:cyanophycinase-like exopeptidase
VAKDTSGSPTSFQPGLIVLFGSGETSSTGRKIFEKILRRLPPSPRLALLETPAGFELNSQQVISRVGDFFTHHLQNYTPRVQLIPARKRGTHLSPDEPAIVQPLLEADLIFIGPGSPSYAVRQLSESLAWHYIIARHRLGAVLALASAAAVAFSACALPVYEIYKVGEELHWLKGLDFFKLYGLQLVFIPHWNNREGGAGLDTSRCFMGQERFAYLMEMLPEEMNIIGLDEKTALLMDLSTRQCQVMGLGKVTLIHTGHKHLDGSGMQPRDDLSAPVPGSDADLANIAEQRGGHFHQYGEGQSFSMSELGNFNLLHPEAVLPQGVWRDATSIASCLQAGRHENPPGEILKLIMDREKARQSGNWILADQLRRTISGQGWEILDTKDGPVSKKLAQK